MNVTLINYTGCGSKDPGRFAANVLLFTKSTRLQMSPSLMEEIEKMSETEVMFNLKLMSDTNPGSWEFVNLHFLLENVTRAFQQQLTRTRTASYAIQTTRLLDMRNFKYDIPHAIANDKTIVGAYKNTMENTAMCYKFLVDDAKIETEDARGILPLNMYSNINMSINMRNWINLVRKRESIRVQTEYRKVLDHMVMAVEKVYPWIYLFVKNDEMKARKDLQNMIYENDKLSAEEKTAMVKKLDIIMKEL
jgi:flavin-dependent thymidylate synthase